MWVRVPPSPWLEMTGYANRQSGQVESLCSVGSTPTSVMNAGEAQLAEHPAFNRTEVGSSPSASIEPGAAAENGCCAGPKSIPVKLKW